MKITDFSVRRPVTICMIVLCVILLGGVSLTRLSLDLYPDITFPVAVAIADYPGAGPQEVESVVTKPLEETLGTVQNVDRIESSTSSGSSTVIVWFNWGTDMDYATLQMREKIDFIKGFLPDDVSDPMVVKMDPAMMPIVQLGMSGGRDMADLKKTAEDVIKPKLERLEGVASVVVTGGYEREIQIIADPVKMEAYGVGLGQIESALSAENMNLSSGQVTEGNKELYVRTMAEYKSLDDIRRVHISLSAGGSVFLEDIAEVKDTSSEQNQITRMNGEPSVGIHVLKQSKANTVKVSADVHEELEKLSKEIPGGIKVATVFDQATFINQSIGTVTQNASIGGILSIIILFLILRNVRSTMVIGIAIPIAIIGTFTLLYLNGLTLNMMSLGGLALGIGMMLDSSIVILENIYRYREEGYGCIDAAIKGADEVAMAVMASTLTSVAVFLPIVFVEGIAAQLFRELALTVSFSLLASLMVALTLVPMLSSKLLMVNGKEENTGAKKNVMKRAGAKMGAFLSWLDQKYGKILSWALNHRKKVVIGVFIALIATFALIPLVGMEFMPTMDGGQLTVDVELDKGIVLEETNKVTEKIESALSDIEEVETVFASVGAQGNQMAAQNTTPEVAQISVMLVPKSRRTRSSEQVAEELRKKLKGIPGAEIEVSVTDTSGMGTGAPVSIKIKGDELDQLEQLAEEIMAVVEKVPGTREVESSITVGRPEMQIKIDRDRADMYGLSVVQVASAVRTAFQGSVATQYRTGGDEIDVRVILPEEYRQNLQDLKRVQLTSPLGMQVQLGEVAEFSTETGPTTIGRENQARIATVDSQISGRDLNSVTKDIKAALKGFVLPKGYTIEYGGQNADMMEAFGNLALALILAIILVYMVMASQFESLVHPFIIMFSMPTTFIGVVLGLALTRRTFSVPTFIGVILLAGIVVNNAIVLVDYINTLRRRGLSRTEAITKAGPTRLRPILMTTLTTALGMLPLALGVGEGSEAQAPMATAVIGGLMVSTLFTLVFIPVVYTIIDDFGGWLKRKLRIGSKKQPVVKGETI